MKNELLKKVIVAVILATVCTLNICAKAILPYGQFTKKPWQAKYLYALNSETGAAENWYATDFDDSEWDSISGPMSDVSSKYSATQWPENHSTYWVRRTFTLDSVSTTKFYTSYFIHDDICEAYINGKLVYQNNNVVPTTKFVNIPAETLKKGNNLMAVKVCDNGGGDAYIDFGLYEYTPTEYLISRADTKVTITNDENYPWAADGTNECITNGNCGNPNSTSSISLTYESDYATEVSFDWLCYNYYQHSLAYYVDGEQKGTTTNSSFQTLRFILDTGKHTITFFDSIGNHTATSNYSRIKNFRIKEITPIDTVVLAKNSKKLTFKNNGAFPWTTENGYIQSSNYGNANSASSFCTTFTIEKASMLSFERTNASSNNSLYLIINNKIYNTDKNQFNEFTTYSVALEPGTYTVEWKDSIANYTHQESYSRIRNICLTDESIDVNLAAAGTLGAELLSRVEFLADIELLKVTGEMNDADWRVIKYLTNVVGLDLLNAKVSAIPNNAFEGLNKLSYAILPKSATTIGQRAFISLTNLKNVNLPEGLIEIGEDSFNNSGLIEVDIPATVLTIKNSAFRKTPITEINFHENSKLETIENSVFADCKQLKKFIMPGTVTSIGQCLFEYCYKIEEVVFSDKLTKLPYRTCCDCYELEKIHLPKNLKEIGGAAFISCKSFKNIKLPESLTSIDYEAFCGIIADSIIVPQNVTNIGSTAFQHNDSLEYIELPAYVKSYNNTFQNCHNIKTIVCKSATAPTNIINDPFNAIDKTAVKLRVPTFAVMDYRLDPYWHQFSSTEGGANTDYYNIADTLTLTNNLRPEGKPSIDLNHGGKLIVNGNAPIETGQLNIFINENNPAVLLNNSIFKADSVNIKLSVSANKWYFITPLYDVKLKDVTHSENASFVFRYYDSANRATNGTGNNWKNVNGNKLHAGMGYIFQCSKAGTVTFPAEVQVHAQLFCTTDVTAKLEEHPTEIAANKNWNYIGNPYPTYYDIYYLGFTAPITVWTGNTYRAYSIADDELALYPMQTFFVQKPEGVDSIIFHKEGRLLTSAIDRKNNIKARKDASAAPRFLFNMQIAANDTLVDETRVVINEKASTGYEMQSDASKFMSLKSEVPQIFTIDNEGNSYAINERPLSDGSIALGYNVSRMGFYTISATGADGKIELTDNLLNKSVDITQESYMFHSGATAGNNTTRFTLKVTLDNNGLTSIDTPTATTTVTAGKGVLNIVTNESTSYTIYTTDGQTAAVGETESATTVTLPAGTYIVKANDKIFKAIVF